MNDPKHKTHEDHVKYADTFTRTLIAQLADELRFAMNRTAARCEELRRAALDATPEQIANLLLDAETARLDAADLSRTIQVRINELSITLEPTQHKNNNPNP